MLQLKAELAEVITAEGAQLEALFHEFDEDGDGVVDRGELKRGLQGLGAGLSEQTVDDMFSMLDLDGDGLIELAEFGRWFGAGPPPAPMLPEVEARQRAKVQ